jgi:hypothetical protein
MAGYGDGAANNGFGRRSLHQWEARLLHMAGYPLLPDFRALGGWHLSVGGVPIPLPLVGGDALDVEINAVLVSFSDGRTRRSATSPTTTPPGASSFIAGTNGNSRSMTVLPLLQRATTPSAAAAGGAHRAAPSRMCSRTSRVTTTPS